MADSKSRLTKEEKQLLQHLLRCRHLSLLYKGSIDTYNINTFHNICNQQGPTVVVAYNARGYIFGADTSQSYTSSGNYINDSEAFLYRLKGKESSPLQIPVKVPSQAVYDVSGIGPCFGARSIIFLSQNRAEVATDATVATYTFRPEDLHGNDQALLEYAGDLMKTPWRQVEWTPGERSKLMDEIGSYKPYLNSVPQYRVLFLGPVGAGKSSFFNSVNSAFRGYVTNQAIAGSDSTSVTMEYRTYGVKNKHTGQPLPIVFCDTMGLEEKQGAGLDMDEVANLLKGHVPDRYQFNPSNAIHPNVPGYIKRPDLKDQIHCVVFIIDGSKVEILPEKLEEKLKDIRRKAIRFGVPQLVLMTKVDEISPLLEEDVSRVYRSKAVQRQMQLIEGKFGIPLNQIVPVKNYSSELELRNDVDILILLAVRQILRSSESYLDNFPLEKE